MDDPPAPPEDTVAARAPDMPRVKVMGGSVFPAPVDAPASYMPAGQLQASRAWGGINFAAKCGAVASSLGAKSNRGGSGSPLGSVASGDRNSSKKGCVMPTSAVTRAEGLYCGHHENAQPHRQAHNNSTAGTGPTRSAHIPAAA